jgi:hypothetical protein
MHVVAEGPQGGGEAIQPLLVEDELIGTEGEQNRFPLVGCLPIELVQILVDRCGGRMFRTIEPDGLESTVELATEGENRLLASFLRAVLFQW